jgi:glycerate 2-kinase
MTAPAGLASAAAAALAAVDAGAAVRTHAADWLVPGRPRRLLAIGKAASAMAQAALALAGPCPCLVVTKHGHGARIPGARVLESGHPVPDDAGLAAADEVERFVAGMPEAELVVLLSGGASALLPAPRAPLTLADLQATTRLLLASGADITALNTVRRHLDRLKGGQLAALAAPAQVRTVAISDVVGDDPAAIGSGPTVPDPTTWADARDALAAARILDAVPAAVRALIDAGCAGRAADTPKAQADRSWPWRAVASNRQAVAAAATALRAAGRRVVTIAAPITGEAAEAGRALARQLLALPTGSALVAGGEPTVTLGVTPGLGGRNQELALAAAEILAGSDACLLSLATDGSDGPTDAAGAWVDGSTWDAASADALARHDAFPLLDRRCRLWRTGPTGTNVCDVVIGLRG